MTGSFTGYVKVTPVFWTLFRFGMVKFKRTSDVMICTVLSSLIQKQPPRRVVPPTQSSPAQATINPLNHCKIVRNLSPWQRKMTVHIINSKKRLTTSQMAKPAK
ncbi:hypothetical protein BDV23DRAFT_101882 [Aspergillus alliaceus]|uniref:Uncharacterized protein n=1 Tax=Petromyces alliaceus TaxID=209559 RepID=A0A5N7C4E9_PETAA|nr:hypothetical protein BDV23DRAFT_101882 [Aspergillus alliaceus]